MRPICASIQHYHSMTMPDQADMQGVLCLQDFLVPLQATIDTKWHQPAIIDTSCPTPSTTSVRVTLSDLHLQPSFGHVPMLQALLDQGRMSAAKRTDVRL